MRKRFSKSFIEPTNPKANLTSKPKEEKPSPTPLIGACITTLIFSSRHIHEGAIQIHYETFF
jgi:hypothetical protein